jgi:hypothetical protein
VDSVRPFSPSRGARFAAACRHEEGFVILVRHLKENRIMTGIQFVTDEKGRKVGVLIDLKKHGAVWEDFWDGLISESRRKEKGIPYEQYRANRLERTRQHG